MIHGSVQVHVKDFNAFLELLESTKDRAAEYGLLRTQLFRNLEDPNYVLMILEWSTDEFIAQFIEDTTPMFMQHATEEPTIFNVSDYYEIAP